MSERDDGGPAFPIDHHKAMSGMSLRDWFAGQAIAAMCQQIEDVDNGKEIAAHAYRLADAMLAERAK